MAAAMAAAGAVGRDVMLRLALLVERVSAPRRKKLSRSGNVGCNKFEMDDAALLHEYATTGSNDAFRKIVERHVDWVYAIARRQVHDPHLAHDVTQGVFLALAQKAGRFPVGISLTGWLFKAAHFGAKGALRMQRRRSFHETRAAALAASLRADSAPSLIGQLSPAVEAAISRLKAADRDAVLLRFYQKKSHQEVAEAIGVTEEAAKKRVARAVEKLRAILRRHGVTVENTALSIGLAEMVTQAPQGLAGSVISSIAAGSGGSLVAAGIAREIIGMIALAKAKLAAAWATSIVVVGIGGTVAVAAAWNGGGPAPLANKPPPAAAASGARRGGGSLLPGLVQVRAEPVGDTADQPPLVDAAQRVDVRQVERLIAGGANPNVVGRGGETSLHEVVKMSWPDDKIEAGVEIVKLLLDKGADPMATDDTGWTAIEQLGAKNEQAVAVIRQRLERLLKEAKPDRRNPPPLVVGRMSMVAAQRGELLVLRLRLARGADPNGADQNGRPLMHQAVTDRREFLELLVAAGANVNLPDRITGDTPLHVAVTFEKYDVAKYLIGKGADPFRANSIGQSAVYYEGEKRKHTLFDEGMIKAEREDVDAWGPSAQGVQARLRRMRESWKAGEQPAVRLDVWNHWDRRLEVDLNTLEVEVDGKVQKHAGDRRDLAPQVWVTDVLVPLGELAPGAHRVKARMRALSRDGKPDLVVETAERVVLIR